MMKRDELLTDLDLYLAALTIPDYCPNGLQVEGKEEITRIATAVSANLMTIEEAARRKVDALIVHHGLFWKGDAFPIVGSKQKKLKLLLENGISLFAYHLPLDAHREVGNNWRAALDLGWELLEPFGEMNGTMLGVKGRIPPMEVEAFIEEVEGFYGHSAARALGGPAQIERVALISGGAYRELTAAAHEGIDCFITGNFDEPAWGMAHEEGIHFLALGHSATERIGPIALGNYISEKLGLDAEFIDVENPF